MENKPELEKELEEDKNLSAKEKRVISFIYKELLDCDTSEESFDLSYALLSMWYTILKDGFNLSSDKLKEIFDDFLKTAEKYKNPIDLSQMN